MCVIVVPRWAEDWRWWCIADRNDRIRLPGSGLWKRAGGGFLGGWTWKLVLIFGPVAEQQGRWWGTSLVAEATADILVSCGSQPPNLYQPFIKPTFSIILETQTSCAP